MREHPPERAPDHAPEPPNAGRARPAAGAPGPSAAAEPPPLADVPAESRVATPAAAESPGDAPAARSSDEPADAAPSAAAGAAEPPGDAPAPPATEPVVDPGAGSGSPLDEAIAEPRPEEAAPALPPPPVFPPVVDVMELDWAAVRAAADPATIRARMRATVEGFETLLDQAGGPGLLFDASRAGPTDRAIRIDALDPEPPLWFIGDLHGDLLALEAALALIRQSAAASDGRGAPRIVLLGDLFDDGAYGLELLLRVFELITDDPGSVCMLTGNHDEALSYDGARFFASVSPSDFSEFVNAHLAHEWMVRAGKLAVRLFADAPRALFFPDGLLAAHGGFPLADLHPALRSTGDFNAPDCLSDFVWTRAHPRARKKMPNRVSRGSQFGYEDFAAFCELSAELGRGVTHMVRGHDHVEERYAVFPAYAAHPILTTVALARRLPRESFGPAARVPTVARWVPGALPQVHRLHVPVELLRDLYPDVFLADAPGPDDPPPEPAAGR